jgi:hypothetical protein
MAEILNWIDIGPLLQQPTINEDNNIDVATVTTPAHIPARLTYVPVLPESPHANTSPDLPMTVPQHQGKQRVSKAAQKNVQKQRVSKAGKQRVLPPRRAKETQKQYVFSALTDIKTASNKKLISCPTRTRKDIHKIPAKTCIPVFVAPDLPPDFVDESIEDNIDRFIKWCEMQDQVMSAVEADPDILARAMPESNLPPVFPIGPLNLNPDGTDINYRKSHDGPNATYWRQADGEEISRLLTTGTIRPLRHCDLPQGIIVTYVNPVCVEKRNDDGSMKFRTRLTIGGDRIVYPYDTTAVTADLESLKILLNCMISEDAQWSTIDLTDFYLGTELPHPEFIRIPRKLIPPHVTQFYNLGTFFHKEALYCSVHKTHYGLPQSGALSQQRLFAHLKARGYHQLPNTPSVFRNNDGSIRFTLVVDDFAVVWTNQQSIDHFISTLTELYQIKVNWLGTKYLGMYIDINRSKRYVTLTMPGYIDKLIAKVYPEGIKGASTPAIYSPPNYANPGAHKATVDLSPPATDDEKKLLQTVVGTLL